MPYTYSVFLFVVAYLLYTQTCSEKMVVLLSFLVFLGLFGLGIECCVKKEWLNRYF